mgnify:CR=1 FL=1
MLKQEDLSQILPPEDAWVAAHAAAPYMDSAIRLRKQAKQAEATAEEKAQLAVDWYNIKEKYGSEVEEIINREIDRMIAIYKEDGDLLLVDDSDSARYIRSTTKDVFEKMENKDPLTKVYDLNSEDTRDVLRDLWIENDFDARMKRNIIKEVLAAHKGEEKE